MQGKTGLNGIKDKKRGGVLQHDKEGTMVVNVHVGNIHIWNSTQT